MFKEDGSLIKSIFSNEIYDVFIYLSNKQKRLKLKFLLQQLI